MSNLRSAIFIENDRRQKPLEFNCVLFDAGDNDKIDKQIVATGSLKEVSRKDNDNNSITCVLEGDFKHTDPVISTFLKETNMKISMRMVVSIVSSFIPFTKCGVQ